MAEISNVFVLMLENHSFDNIFAMSGIPGIGVASLADKNVFGGQDYPVQDGAPINMPTDPGHEFLDVFEQLAGPNAVFNPNQQYASSILNSGFVSNYATTTTEGKPPQPDDFGKIMACFKTPAQLPVIYQLAKEFAICDQWFSSLPGPTWPNRFFVHGASSSDLDHSPTDTELAEWDTIEGFSYPNGSIYDALNRAGIKWRLYNDNKDAESDKPENRGGSIAQVAAIRGIRLDLVKSLTDFASDLQAAYPYQYTFIEPNYGNILNGTYEGGSSQHPMDDVYGGESLIKLVYEAIRNSPLWNTSLLIIVYDEHGGFYDSCIPGPVPAPNDVVGHSEYNKYSFNFTQLGVRVPAVIVSPLIPAGTVDHTTYDHASVPATVERLWKLKPLTARDMNAADVLALLTLAIPRTDCPATLVNPAPPGVKAASAPMGVEPAVTDDQPLPTSGNVRGFLAIAAKTEVELSSGTDDEKAAIVQNHHKIKTRGHAKNYVGAVMAKVDVARANRVGRYQE